MIVLIPAYEPTDRLPELVRALMDADPTLDVVVVDDGSGPSYTRVFACAAAAGAEILSHDRNRGKGAALKTGFRHAMQHRPGAAVVTADADGQHKVSDILALVAAVRDQVATPAAARPPGLAVVLGCRPFDGRVPLRSRFGNDVSRVLFRVAAGWRLSDTQTGLRGMPAAMLPWLLQIAGERFEYEQRMLLELRRAGYTARELRIETVYLERNASSHFRPVLDSARVMLPLLLFAASSLLGFAVDALALFALTALTGALVPSIIGARVLSASVNFWVNRHVVFRRRGSDRLWRQLGSYTLLAVVVLASNVVWMSYLTGIGIPLWLAKLVTEVVLFVTSYRVQRSGIFGDAVPVASSAVAVGSSHTPGTIPAPDIAHA